jgi:hypothetical protein
MRAAVIELRRQKAARGEKSGRVEVTAKGRAGLRSMRELTDSHALAGEGGRTSPAADVSGLW